jgi:N-acetylmuramoyl-L-alanine amidase
MRILLLRANDQTLSAETRAELANRAGADLLVSLHCNGAFNSSARGVEVLYPEPTPSTAGDAALAASQSGVAEFNAAETVFLPYADESAVWAEMVRDELADALGGTNRGARAAPIDLLRLVAMPSVQVECGFLTHPQEAARFGTADFADRLATALAAAIDKYRARYVDGTTKDRRKP